MLPAPSNLPNAELSCSIPSPSSKCPQQCTSYISTLLTDHGIWGQKILIPIKSILDIALLTWHPPTPPAPEDSDFQYPTLLENIFFKFTGVQKNILNATWIKTIFDSPQFHSWLDTPCPSCPRGPQAVILNRSCCAQTLKHNPFCDCKVIIFAGIALQILEWNL